MHDHILHLLKEGLYLALLISAPPVLASMFVGLFVSVLQATTQIQEQTLTVVPKLVAVFLSLLIAGPWIGAQLIHFTTLVFESIGVLF